MKTVFKNIYAILPVLLLSAAGCAPGIVPENPSGESPQEEIEVPEGMVRKQFTASISDMTKASIVGNGVKFSGDEKIAVYDGTLKNEFSVKSVDGGLAVFEGFVTEGSTDFKAVFPYSCASDSQPVDGAFTVSVPSIQKVDKVNPTDGGAIVSLAVADKVGHLQFRNVVSLVTVSVPDGARRVVLSATGDIPLAGSCSATPGGRPEGASESEVILLPSTESGRFSAGLYNVCTLPASLPDGLVIKVEDDSQQAVVRVDKFVELSRSSQVDLTAAFRNMVWIRNFIGSARELRDFAAASSTYGPEDLVGLSADIDLSGEDWTPFDLNCTLDGLGHRITGINVSGTGYRTGFVGTLKDGAVLRNIVLGSSDGTSYDGTSAVTYNGTVAAYLGGVVSDCQGLVENVKSFVGVNYACTAKVDCHIGGICGNVGGNGRITGCEFAGGMTINDNASGGTRKAGGITGRMHNDLVDAQTVNACTFSGVITSSDSKMEGVGGIAGHMQGGNIVSCISKGRINMNYNGAAGYVGGVVGYYQSYASSYTSEVSLCTNSTVIESTQRVLAAAGIVGYIQRGATGPLTVSGCTNNADICLKTAPTAMTCLGGIIGYSQKLSATDMLKVKLTVKDNTNNGKIECNISGTASTLNMGGICGYVSGTVAFEIGGNTNNGNVTINGKLVRTGGIVGWLNSPDAVVFGNVNRGALSQTNSDKMSACGGIIGYGENSLSMSDNFNSGSVTISCPTASDNYAAGLIGQFNGSSSSGSPNVLNITNDRSIGAISSPGRAGVIFSALSGGTYVTCNLNNVGIGGSKNGTGVTADNYGNHLWSYTNSTYHKVTGAASCKYVSE